MAEDTPAPPATSTATGGMLGGETCWKCGGDRDAFGDGSRHCTNCGAGELGWVKL